MRKATGFLVCLLYCLLVVSFTAQAAFAEVIYGLTAPISQQDSSLNATACTQMCLIYQGKSTWQWDARMGRYPENIPTCLGICMRVYPNVSAAINRIIGVYASFSELDKSLKNASCLMPCQQEIGTCRWFIDIPVDKYPGPQCLRFYALVEGANRHETRILVFIKRVKHTDGYQLVDTFNYTTSPWPGNPPDPTTLARYESRAGLGGSGMAYYQLIAADNAALRSSSAGSSDPPSATGDVAVTVNFIGNFSMPLKLSVLSPGASDATEQNVTTNSYTLTLAANKDKFYQMKFVTNDRVESNWFPFKVFPGMGPIKIKNNN